MNKIDLWVIRTRYFRVVDGLTAGVEPAFALDGRAAGEPVFAAGATAGGAVLLGDAEGDFLFAGLALVAPVPGLLFLSATPECGGVLVAGG